MPQGSPHRARLPVRAVNHRGEGRRQLDRGRTRRIKGRASYQAIYVVLILGVLAFSLVLSVLNPVLPQVQAELETDQNTVTWVLTAYLLSAAVATPIIGRAGDAVGKKKMLLLALGGLCAGSVLSALADDIATMAVGRALTGLGGGTLPLAFGIIRDEFPKARTAAAVSLIASLSAVGAGFGVVVAGPIVSLLSYEWLFWLPAIFTAFVFVGTLIVVPESPSRTRERISVLPAVLLCSWLVSLLLAISQGRTWGWTSPLIGGLLAAVLLALLWVMAELRVPTPLVDMRMMRRRGVWTVNLVAFLVGTFMYASFALVPQFVQTSPSEGYGFGASITEAGVMLLPMTVFSFIMGASADRLSRAWSPKGVVITSCGMCSASLVWLGLVNAERWQIYVGASVLGMGTGLIFSSLAGLIVVAVPPDQTGVASGMNANIRTVGGALGAVLTGAVVTAQVNARGIPAESGYTAGFLVLAATGFLAMLAGLLIPRTWGVVSSHPSDDVHPELGLVPGAPLLTDEAPGRVVAERHDAPGTG